MFKNPSLFIQEFPLRGDLMYLNHAAISPWPSRTVKAITDFSNENLTLGSRNYPCWMKTEDLLRRQLKQLINANSDSEIALLKNTSEALSVVAFGLDWQPGDNIVSLKHEFPSNRIVWEALASKGVELRLTEIDSANTELALLNLVDKRTRLISISSVQYTNGFRLDLEMIGDFCRNNNILFCIDAIQSVGALQIDVQNIHADFMMADGHKWMLGPEGLALFYCRQELLEQLQLHQYGWHMTDAYTNFDNKEWHPVATARRFECGSPNMLGIHALSASLSLLLEIGMPEIESRVLGNTQLLVDAINNSKQLSLLSSTKADRQSGIVTFNHRTLDNQTLFTRLTQNEVMCALRGGGIRFSPHFYTPKENIIRAINLAEQA